uniref:BRCT domain-containing protein n=1 Tax=Physcomitrium patens TaxID=3218 RepID=A0A2K1IWN9_PHYPA|nr:hypothetical protein PHYPA_023509 [Physcomitrium patens]
MAGNQVDKTKDLHAKACRVLGPEYIFQCAREWFFGYEKKELEELVTSVDGTLQEQALSDVDVVVAKDVLAPKYDWACRIVGKPLLMSSWLRQCAREHRQISHDLQKVLPLAGLTICPFGIVFDNSYRIQRVALRNQAAYNGDLTKECSHLIVLLLEGRKYQVAKDMGLMVVSQNWF